MATYKGKTIVSVSFAPSIEETKLSAKNIAVLLEDNQVLNVKYGNLIAILTTTEKEAREIQARLEDLKNLKAVIQETLSL